MTKKRVLVVDDYGSVRQQVSLALSPAGFEVIEAIDGQMGVDVIVADHSLSLVICDVNMPRMNGLDLLRIVREKPAHAELPIIMLTTDGQPAQIRRAKDLGARGWVVKPFNPAQLLSAVQKLAGMP